MRTRVKDVARAAGVSVGTVSNVPNRPEIVRDTTRSRVQAEMARLGFVRNESARRLRQGRSRTLAYVFLDGMLLIAETTDEAHEHQGVTFTPELVVRDSTRKTRRP